ncbi:MAG: peptidylprolyl isomerase [Alphaproteobacteria bacterium]|nr:peptidylprolyl isomerase [Alphaproteobacteria bacterium]
MFKKYFYKINLCLGILFIFGISFSVNAQTDLGIIAVVNDGAITAFDLEQRARVVMLSSKLQDMPEVRKKIMPQILRGLIDEQLKFQEAKKNGINVSEEEVQRTFAINAQNNKISLDEFKQKLQTSGIDLNAFSNQIRNEIAWNKLRASKLRSKINISPDEVEERLQILKSNIGKPEYKISEIFLPTDNPDQINEVKQTADRLLEQIHEGADFSNIARDFSYSASSARGGDLGWVHATQLDSQLELALRDLKPGQLTEPIRITGGYTILLLQDRRMVSDFGSSKTMISIKQFPLPITSMSSAAEIEGMKKRLKTLISEAQNCDQFGRLAEENSPNARVDLAKTFIDELPEELRNIVKDLPVQVASAPVQLPGAIVSFMVCEKEEADPQTIARNKIAQQLELEQLDSLEKAYLRDLRRVAFIQLRQG